MSFSIGVPQVIYIFLMLFKVVYEVINHGKPREGNHDAMFSILVLPLPVALLWWGGFFG